MAEGKGSAKPLTFDLSSASFVQLQNSHVDRPALPDCAYTGMNLPVLSPIKSTTGLTILYSPLY